MEEQELEQQIEEEEIPWLLTVRCPVCGKKVSHVKQYINDWGNVAGYACGLLCSLHLGNRTFFDDVPIEKIRKWDEMGWDDWQVWAELKRELEEEKKKNEEELHD